MIKFYTALMCLAISGILSAQSTITSSNKTSQAPTNIKQAYGMSDTRNTQEESLQNDLPGFPSYISTGNKELDDANYEIAKEKWISENQTLYTDYLKRKESESNNLHTEQNNPNK